MPFRICGVTLPHMTGQAPVHLSTIQIARYAEAACERLRDLMVDVYERAPGTRVVFMANHGLEVAGPTPLEACHGDEIVEDSAQAYLHCKLLAVEPKLDS